MLKARMGAAAVAVSLSLLATASALAASQQKHYYLALGDSLSVGFQPTGPSYAGVETKQGYVNDLYAKYSREVGHLKLKDIGCPGDTTGSLLTGSGNDASAKQFHCDRKGGSQLHAAVKFLKAHHSKGEVPLVTIDIGANDVDGCVNEPTESQILSCVSTGENEIKTQTPKILKALRKAAPKGTKLAAMNLYDPVLAYELSSNSSEQTLGKLSLSLVKDINDDIATADKSEHFKTADVAGAFDTYDTTPEAFDGQQVPTDVVNICQLTWMCAPAPQGPNIHANKAGYKLIAKAFEKVIGKLR